MTRTTAGLMLLLIGFNGCAPVLIASGALVGYAVSRDSVVVELDRSWDQVFKAAKEELKEAGFLRKEDVRKGHLQAKVRDCDVAVTLRQMTPSTIRMVIRSRKNLLPKIDVAQKLALNIQRRSEKAGRLF